MTDRELLELAAKAAGIVNYTFHDGVFQPKCLFVETGSRRGDQGYYWSPLTDDGDALRLAVKLAITIGPESPDLIGKSLCRASWNNRSSSLGEYGDGDIYAATRRAIVRAAAEIGRVME